MAKLKVDERVDKRKVSMRNRRVVDTAEGTVILEYGPDDFVRPDILDAYVADARTRWDKVEVGDEPDAGPAGYDGPTFVPPTLDHELAGNYYPAADCKDCTHAPEGARVVTEG